MASFNDPRSVSDLDALAALSPPATVDPDLDLLTRVAAQGEAGAQGFDRQRQAKEAQDRSVQQALATGTFELPGGQRAVQSQNPLSSSNLPVTRTPLNDRGTALSQQELAAAAPRTPTPQEAVMKALLGVDLRTGELPNLQELDSRDRQDFFTALEQLQDFQTRETEREFALEERQLAMEQARRAQEIESISIALDLEDRGLSPERIAALTGVNMDDFGGERGLERQLDELEAESALEDRARGLTGPVQPIPLEAVVQDLGFRGNDLLGGIDPIVESIVGDDRFNLIDSQLRDAVTQGATAADLNAAMQDFVETEEFAGRPLPDGFADILLNRWFPAVQGSNAALDELLGR